MQIAFLAPSPSVAEDRPKSIGTNLKSSPAILIRGILWGGGQVCAQNSNQPKIMGRLVRACGF